MLMRIKMLSTENVNANANVNVVNRVASVPQHYRYRYSSVDLLQLSSNRMGQLSNLKAHFTGLKVFTATWPTLLINK